MAGTKPYPQELRERAVRMVGEVRPNYESDCLARDATEITWRRSPRPQLLVTATQHTELVALAARATTVLGEGTSQKLATWLARTRPGG